MTNQSDEDENEVMKTITFQLKYDDYLTIKSIAKEQHGATLSWLLRLIINNFLKKSQGSKK